jgi:glycosyltransferase involved in cell wall biosynthesis
VPVWQPLGCLPRRREGAVTIAQRCRHFHVADLSIITPSYNYAGYLPQCLASVDALARRGDAVEHVVVDDCSTDDSVAVIAATLDRAPHRILVQHPRNLGLSAALNTGLAKATGKWICWLNADDACHDDGLLRALDAARSCDDRVGLFYGDVKLIDEHGMSLGVLRLYRGATLCLRLGYNPLLVSSVLFRRSFLTQGFDPKYRLLMDFDAYLTVLAQGSARYLPYVIGEWRVHPAQQCAVSRPTDADEWRYLSRKHSCRFRSGPTRVGRNAQRLLKAGQGRYRPAWREH